MSVIYDFNVRQAEKKARELKIFLSQLDGICDTLYGKLEYEGVWNVLMNLEDVRVKYYVEYHENVKLTRLHRKGNP